MRSPWLYRASVLAGIREGGKIEQMSFESCLMYFSDFASAIPPVVLGAALASCITLLGVLISNRHTLQRLRIQLDADAKQKKEERTSEIRKDVLLSLTAEVMRFGSILADIGRKDIAEYNALESLRDITFAFAKAHVVAEPSTVLLINKLSHLYVRLHNSVISKIGPLQRARTNIASTKRKLDDSLVANKALIQQFEVIGHGDQNTNEHNQLRERCLVEVERARETGVAMMDAHKNFISENINLRKFISSELAKLVDVQRELLAHVRQDLGFTGDLPGLKEQVESQQKQLSAQIEEFFESVPREIEAIEALSSAVIPTVSPTSVFTAP